MTGFNSGSSGIGRDHSANCATTCYVAFSLHHFRALKSLMRSVTISELGWKSLVNFCFYLGYRLIYFFLKEFN